MVEVDAEAAGKIEDEAVVVECEAYERTLGVMADALRRMFADAGTFSAGTAAP